METKDRTQASYNLVDISEQTRIAFEKCKETKEQKIERLKKEIKDYKKFRKFLGKQACIGQSLLDFHSKKIKELEQELKELENGV